MTHDNSELDEILDIAGFEPYKKTFEIAKQQILSKYLPKADLVEYLNGLKVDVRPEIQEWIVSGTKESAHRHNQLLDEIIKHVEES